MNVLFDLGFIVCLGFIMSQVFVDRVTTFSPCVLSTIFVDFLNYRIVKFWSLTFLSRWGRLDRRLLIAALSPLQETFNSIGFFNWRCLVLHW